MNTGPSDEASRLRRRAEEKIGGSADSSGAVLSPAEMQRLLQELRVHQVELEMQNEALDEARACAETAAVHYTELFDSAPVGYVRVERDGTIREVNLAAAHFLEMDRKLIVGAPFRVFISPRDLSAVDTMFADVFDGKVNASCDVALSVESQRVRQVHIDAVLSASGTECRATLSDITARLRSEHERQQLQSELKEAQKLESVGRLAGGVAHDFNNMLQAIQGNATLALHQLEAGSRLRENLTAIQACADRAAELTKMLLAFARVQTSSPTFIDLGVFVESRIAALRTAMNGKIDLVWRPSAVACPVKMDPAQVDHILSLLCVRAREASTGRGVITLSTTNVTVDDAYASTHHGLVTGGYVLLTCHDNGTAMEPSVLEHLFEPFFTSRAGNEAAGLGLASVYGVVKQNHGIIYVSSAPHHGSTFDVYLPRREGPLVAPIHPVLQGRLKEGNRGETILLVEDEQPILLIAKKVLMSLGYHVLPAGSAAEALAVAAQPGVEIDLLMTDVIMPGMNGRQLSEQLLQTHPKLKCLFMSGYTADVIADHGAIDERFKFIQKPFMVAELAEKVRDALEG